MLLNLGILIIIVLFIVPVSFSYLQIAMAEEPQTILQKTNDNGKNNDDKLVVVSIINLQNIEKKGLLKVVGVINGEDFVKNISLDKLKETTKKLKVKFSMDKENEIISSHKLDEFFICAYHVKNPDNLKSISFDSQNLINYFDCNEGDIKSTTSPTEINLFKVTSQVYNKTSTYYNMYSKPKVISFDTLNNDTITSYNNNLNNIKEDKAKNDKDDNDKPVQVKIIVPMEDKKDAKKIKVMAMLKGQIKSAIIDDVQKEFDKIGGYTIERTFAFDRNTDIGPIQIGDRYHACVSGNDLNPPEGTECEKRTVKIIGRDNVLYAR